MIHLTKDKVVIQNMFILQKEDEECIIYDPGEIVKHDISYNYFYYDKGALIQNLALAKSFKQRIKAVIKYLFKHGK